ncbi:MAG TPA: zincin-like metallopeptidase domain-containing protein [Thermodesulfobacteriota bacterium]|nr:zincin-like metallopeptidase domain-containing protein [Thermodesulfobacteriota bacterium]
MSSVYDNVTGKIMELLQQGEIPWRKPWKTSGGPRNLITRKAYKGINSFLLNCSPYSSPYWLTFKQAQEKGGHIRKGERSSLVVFWKWLDRKGQTTSDDTDTGELSPTSGKIPLLRYYNVFNLDQVDGIQAPQEEEITNPFTPIATADQIIQNMQNRPEIQYGGDRACYSPHLDYIKLPPQESFHSPEEFYSTAFHELAHATGHSSRLNRKGITETSYFGSHEYSQEELVAEFGASMLCGFAGIEQATIQNSAAYIQGWLKVLNGDKRLAIIAAGQGQKACDFILNRKEENDTEITLSE